VSIRTATNSFEQSKDVNPSLRHLYYITPPSGSACLCCLAFHVHSLNYTYIGPIGRQRGGNSLSAHSLPISYALSYGLNVVGVVRCKLTELVNAGRWGWAGAFARDRAAMCCSSYWGLASFSNGMIYLDLSALGFAPRSRARAALVLFLVIGLQRMFRFLSTFGVGCCVYIVLHALGAPLPHGSPERFCALKDEKAGRASF